MNLSFLPGELQLTKTQNGEYLVTLQGEEILRTRAERKALSKFNELRRELESQFPSRELSSEEKSAALRRLIGDALVKHNGDRHHKKIIKKGSTRTFG